MASPFTFFRKNQKTLMAIAAVACMLIFVVGDALSGRGSGGGPSTAATVVTWDGGSLSARQLETLTEQRYLLSEFLAQVYFTGYDSEQDGQPSPPEFIVRRGQSRESVQSQVINSVIFSDLAERAGFSVTDNTINAYIKDVGNGRVGGQEIVQIMARLNRNTEFVENVVYENLRRMLLARLYAENYLDAQQAMMPLDRWEDWRQLNEKISLQAAVLPIEEFLDEAPEPTEDQLKALYEERKESPNNLFADAGGRGMPAPERGFTEPRKVKLHYLRGSLAEWRDKVRDEVTDEAVQKFYDDNKEILFVSPEEDSEESGGEDAAEVKVESDGSAPDDDQSSDEAAPTADEPVEEEALQEEPKEAAEAAEPEAEESAAEDLESDETATDEPAAEEPIDDESLVEEEEEEEAPPEGESEESTTVGESEEPSSPAEEAAADVEDPTDDANDADNNPEESSAGEGEADGAGAETGDDTDADRYDDNRYQPLEEVREQIVDALATEIAAERLRSQMEAAYADLSSEYTRYGAAVALAKDEEKELPDPPKRLLDLEPIAQQYELTLERGALLTQRQMLTESIVGLSRTIDSAGGGGSFVYQLAFSKEWAMYEPVLTNDDPSRDWPGEWYLILKVEDQPRTTPPFEEVRQQVVDAWQRQEAARLALDKSKELVKELETSTASFDNFFSERDIETLTTDSFSRLEFPSAPGQGEAPLLSQGFGLENVGAEFMDRAFELQGDEAAALLNFDHSIAYVIQLHTRAQTEDELRRLFLMEANGWPGMQETRFVRFRKFSSSMYDQLWENINREFDEEWLERQRNQQ